MTPQAPGPRASSAPHLAGYRTPEMCRLAGCSYRQADYWARTGLLLPSDMDAEGSGTQRLYSAADVRVAVVLRSMFDSGFGKNPTPRSGDNRIVLRALIAHVRQHGLHGSLALGAGFIRLDLDALPDPTDPEPFDLGAVTVDLVDEETGSGLPTRRERRRSERRRSAGALSSTH